MLDQERRARKLQQSCVAAMHQQGGWSRKFRARQCPHFSCVHTGYLNFVERCEMPAVLSSAGILTGAASTFRDTDPSEFRKFCQPRSGEISSSSRPAVSGKQKMTINGTIN